MLTYVHLEVYFTLFHLPYRLPYSHPLLHQAPEHGHTPPAEHQPCSSPLWQRGRSFKTADSEEGYSSCTGKAAGTHGNDRKPQAESLWIDPSVESSPIFAFVKLLPYDLVDYAALQQITFCSLVIATQGKGQSFSSRLRWDNRPFVSSAVHQASRFQKPLS